MLESVFITNRYVTEGLRLDVIVIHNLSSKIMNNQRKNRFVFQSMPNSLF